MKIIALDSSGLVASVALLEDDTLVAEYTTNFKKTHSQTLLPMLDEIVKMTEWNAQEADAIAVAGGPGSFTGLRIGSATAKGLALAWDKPVISVPTVDALAYNLYGTNQYICPIMDARRNQVYTGIYTFENGQFQVIKEQCAVAMDEIAEELNKYGKPVIFSGDGVPVHQERLKEIMKVPYSFAPVHLSRQSAGAVGALAMEYYKAGKIQTAAEHAPEYLRMSQAERERMEQQKELKE